MELKNSTSIRYFLTRLTPAEKLIFINVAVYIINAIVVFLFQLPDFYIISWFELPKSIIGFFTQPWSIITYSFFHASFFHLFWNMVLLYFSGRIFLNLFSVKKFINVYFLGAIAGGVLFLLSYNLFPVFLKIDTALIGASAAVTAVLIFICTYLPNQEVRVLFFNVKLWHLGMFFVVLDLIQLPISNSGGHLAHLGGAALGFFYAKQLAKGVDIGAWFSKSIEGIKKGFAAKKKTPLKTVYRNTTVSKSSKNPLKKSEQQHKIDEILDKISKSGYESLTKEEKDFLFKVGRE